MATCTHNQASPDPIVYKPSIRIALHRPKRLSQQQFGTTPLQQVVVKFYAADTITCRIAGKFGLYRLLADLACAKTMDGLQHVIPGIIFEVDFQLFHYGRCNPPGTNFITWKLRLIHDNNVFSGLCKGPGQGRACRTATDDKYISFNHL